MVNCLICGKRIWFFQRKGKSLERKEVLIHLKCYEKKNEEKNLESKKAGGEEN